MPNGGLPQAIIFDVDGVLIDSLDIKGEAFAQAFSDLPERHDEIVAFHQANGGVTRRVKIRSIFTSVFGREPTSNELELRVGAFSANIAAAVVAAPEIRGASLALAEWSGRTPLHAVSATPAEELIRILDERGMSGFFTSVRGWPPRKPDVVKELLDEMGYEPGRCLLVGDSREDLDAAWSAGVHFVQVSKREEQAFTESECVIRDLLSLNEAIESVMRIATQ